MMKRTVVMAIGLCLVIGPVVRAEDTEGADLTDPIEILKKVDKAAKAVKAVQYKARFEAEGTSTSQLPEIEGTAVFLGRSSYPDKFRIECMVKWPGSDETRKMTLGCDKEKHYLVDPASKTVHQDGMPTVLGRTGGRVRRAFLMIEFIHRSPFSDEIHAEKAELTGTAKVGDEECYRIHVKYKDARGAEADWYVSKKDFLPRRVDRIAPAPDGGKAITKLILTELDADPKITDDTFKLVVPEGFKTTTKPAP